MKQRSNIVLFKRSYIKCDHEDLVINHIPVYAQKALFWIQRIHLQELPPTGAMTGHENCQACSEGNTNSTAVIQTASSSTLCSQQLSELGSHCCWIHAAHRRRVKPKIRLPTEASQSHFSQVMEPGSRSHLLIVILNTKELVYPDI